MTRVFLITILLFLHAFAHAEAFVIDINDAHENSTTGQLAERFFTNVYAELGVQPEFVYYPSRRGLRMVDRGYLDAEAGRFESVGNRYPNLIKVNQAILTMHVGLFCFDNKDCRLPENAAIVVLEGMESAAKFCETKQFSCRFESDVNAIIRLLESGIANAFLSTTLSAKHVICNAKDAQISFSELPEFKQQSFHYVNRKHQNLIPKLEEAIGRLRDREPVFRNSNSLSSALNYKCRKDVFIAKATR